MYKRNDGLTEDHRLQNQFTAYLSDFASIGENFTGQKPSVSQ